jgi:hypothetical protein
MSFLSSAGDVTQQTVSGAYAPAVPALGQILTEATNIYNQGVPASGYVAPTQQTLTGIAQAEQMANLAQQQQAATLAGGYLNPFLSPMLQQFGEEAYSTVASQFSGAGRTPGSPVSQQQVASQVAAKALPYAFQTYGQERAFQEAAAQRTPTLTQVGSQLEALQRAEQLAPFQALQQYSGLVSPIGFGFPTQTTTKDVSPDYLTAGLGLGQILLGRGGVFNPIQSLL